MGIKIPSGLLPMPCPRPVPPAGPAASVVALGAGRHRPNPTRPIGGRTRTAVGAAGSRAKWPSAASAP